MRGEENAKSLIYNLMGNVLHTDNTAPIATNLPLPLSRKRSEISMNTADANGSGGRDRQQRGSGQIGIHGLMIPSTVSVEFA